MLSLSFKEPDKSTFLQVSENEGGKSENKRGNHKK